ARTPPGRGLAARHADREAAPGRRLRPARQRHVRGESAPYPGKGTAGNDAGAQGPARPGRQRALHLERATLLSITAPRPARPALSGYSGLGGAPRWGPPNFTSGSCRLMSKVNAPAITTPQNTPCRLNANASRSTRAVAASTLLPPSPPPSSCATLS